MTPLLLLTALKPVLPFSDTVLAILYFGGFAVAITIGFVLGHHEWKIIKEASKHHWWNRPW